MKKETLVIHEKNLKLAKTILLCEGELLSSLMEMKRRNLFVELGCTGMFDYCVKRLNFCESQANYYKRIAEVSAKVPELKAAVVQGELSISKARRITSVITPANHQEWIKNAQTMKQKELEKAVSIVNPQAHPIERIKPLARNISELRVPIDDETDKNLEILKELLSQKLKRPATLADVIAWAAKETREKFDPEKKAERSVKRVSSRKSVQEETRKQTTLRQPIPLAKPGRHPIPASVKHAVILRDGQGCSFRSSNRKPCGQRSLAQFSPHGSRGAWRFKRGGQSQMFVFRPPPGYPLPSRIGCLPHSATPNHKGKGAAQSRHPSTQASVC